MYFTIQKYLIDKWLL